jgi:hypothetical protein
MFSSNSPEGYELQNRREREDFGEIPEIGAKPVESELSGLPEINAPNASTGGLPIRDRPSPVVPHLDLSV